MNWSFKKVGLILLVVFLSFTLWADDSIFITDGDIGSLNLYDSQGNRLDAALAGAGEIEEGWILHNPGSDLTLVTPLGSVILYEDSIILTTRLHPQSIELYLVSGKATFNTTIVPGGSLTVITPASHYRTTEASEFFVITSSDEESITSFSGTVESYNVITGRASVIKPFEKLPMQRESGLSDQIQSGYYMTWATLPTAELAQEQLVRAVAERAVRIPPPPTVARAYMTKITPVAPVVAEPAVPTAVPTISVQVEASEAIETPDAPLTLEPIVEVVVPAPPLFLEPTITPESPAAPSFVTAHVVAVEPEVEPEPVVPTAPMLLEPTIVAPEAEVVVEVAEPVAVPRRPSFAKFVVRATPPPEPEEEVDEEVVEAVVEEPVEAVEIAAAGEAEEVEAVVEPQARPTSLLVREEESKQLGSVGVEIGYLFGLDGTASNELSHRLYAKPYFSKGPFSIKLNAAIETEQFASFENTIVPLPSGRVDLIRYIFTYFDHLRIGYPTSPFYLVLDHQRSLRSELATFFAPQFGTSSRLMLQNQITLGSFTLLSSLDDVTLTNMIDGKSQYASTLLQFTSPGSYPFTIALGTLAETRIKPSHTVDLYPLISAKLPIIDRRTTQLSALVQVQGFLPVYPAVDFDQFIDTSLPSFFPNYLLGAGIAWNQGSFKSRLMVSLNDGMNRNFLVNEFTYGGIDTSYDSAVDLFAELGWESDAVRANLAVNLPFSKTFALADLASGHGADFTQFTLGFDIKDFIFGFGIQHLGIIDTIGDLFSGNAEILDLFGGEWASSFLSLSYTYKPFTFSVEALYPAKSGSFTTPKITVGAKVDVSKRF